MKYVIIAAVILWFTGCGSSGGQENDNPPASPQAHDSSKIPPAVPKID